MLAPVYTSAQIRELEHAALQQPALQQPPGSAPRLMERAGLAAARYARSAMGEAMRRVIVFAGPGNNGGDAFEVAFHLKRWFCRVTVVFTGDRLKLSGDARAALAKWEQSGGTVETTIPQGGRWDLVIDGLFGIGLQRALEGRHAEWVQAINSLGMPVLALDVPSGINADTGAVMGHAVRATRTITFIGAKPGLLTLDGPDHCGELHTDALGLDTEALLPPQGRITDSGVLAQALNVRPRNFHKGLAGTAAVVGGAAGMVGAAMLAGRAALKCGAGRVHLALLTEHPPSVDYAQPELMIRTADGVFRNAEITVLAAGPGMGKEDSAKRVLRLALESPSTLILDADALNLVGENPVLAEATAKRKAATLLTPHPAEAGRLLGLSTHNVQADRLAAALAIARRYRAYAVLKGNGTLIAAPDGRWWINTTGNAGMASAGMGDALTGLIAGLIAQGASPLDGLLAGVWLHGAAGDAVARSNGGPLGLTASELIDSARTLINRAIYPAGGP